MTFPSLGEFTHVYVASLIQSAAHYTHLLLLYTVWYICILQYKLQAVIDTTVGFSGAQTQGFMARGSKRESRKLV